MSQLERYKKLQVKFDLPQLSELKNAFKFDLDSDEEIFDQLRVEMSDRLFSFTERILEPIVSLPDNFSSLYEQSMLTQEEREDVFEIYKKVQALKWENNLLMITPDEKETAKWIKRVWAFWNSELNPKLTVISKKMSSGWKNLKIKDEKTIYHG